MSPHLHHTPAHRDAAVLRLRRINRGLVAVAITGTAVLTEVAASAFPGHTVKRVAQSAALTSGASQTKTVHHSKRRKQKAAALQPPATAPSPSASAQTSSNQSASDQGSSDQSSSTASAPVQQTAPIQQSAPAQTAPVQSTPPTPAYVAPAPVVSGGS